jgi:site-specific DNA-methyltransferase (adenine-specific)
MSRVEHLSDDVQVWLGDCQEILPGLPRVDAVVSDPPYGIALDTDNSRFSGGVSGHRVYGGYTPGSGKGEPIRNDEKPFDPVFLTGYGDEQIIWGWHCFPDKLPKGSCLVWIKRLDPAFGSFLSDAETAWHSRGHGVYCFRDMSLTAEALHRAHPTQKPVPLMSWCIERVKGQTILDPFMGSGTTGVACVQLGRKFIGIELEPRYFEIAIKRISDELRRPRLQLEPVAKPIQEAMQL